MGKGGDYEREVCKQLSLWWTYHKRDDIFWRTAGSGARATTRMKKLMETHDSAGDVMALDPIGKPLTAQVLIEIKRGFGGMQVKSKSTGKKKKKGGKQLEILSLLDTNMKGRKHELVFWQWWDKAENERLLHNRNLVWIIFKRDRKEPCIAMSLFQFVRLTTGSNHVIDTIALANRKRKVTIVFSRLDAFLKCCKPKFLRKRTITRRKK